jgi:hypothetical protein
MDTATSWIIATDAGSYWGKSWGADGITFVKANAYRYTSRENAAKCIAELAGTEHARAFHVEELPPGRKWYR